MDLLGAQGRFRMTHSQWADVLNTAIKHGWEPAGTKAPYFTNDDGTPCEELNVGNDEWDGTYGANNHQAVTAEDARNLAAALIRAAGDVDSHSEGSWALWALAGYASQGGFSIG
jgi:hypothetical protein